MVPHFTHEGQQSTPTVQDLQQVLKGPRTPWSKKLEAAKALREHQAGQYADRVLYWSLRHASQTQAKPVSQSCSPKSSSVLTIIIDDMDHSKFAWPRWPFRKQPHELDNLIRPTVTFTDYFLEVLCQTIETIWGMCGESQAGPSPGTFPSHLIVVADNAVKSAKNQFVLNLWSPRSCSNLAHFLGCKWVTLTKTSISCSLWCWLF